MEVNQLIQGLQHIGIPTYSVEETCHFYRQFGFAVDWSDESGDPVFLKNASCVLEIYHSDHPNQCDGGIDHIALRVNDIEEAYRYVTSLGYQALEGKICRNQVYSNGSCYFTIGGLNHEKIEFSQIM